MDSTPIMDGSFSSEHIAYSGELMLVKKQEGQNWRVTFALPMDTERHPFNAYSGKASGRPGTRFMAVLVELDDDDKPVNQEHKRAAKQTSKERMSGAALVRQTGILRNDKDFQRFLWWKIQHMPLDIKEVLVAELPHGLYSEIERTRGASLSDEKKAKRFADYVVHFLCSVTSCREMAYQGPAAQEFNDLRNEFIQWMAKRQPHAQA